MTMDNRPGAADDLTQLYRDTIRRHAAEPVGYRQDIDATHRHEEFNPLCGDRIVLSLRLAGKTADETVEAVAFDGEACAICMASASLLCENIAGQTVHHLIGLHDSLHRSLGHEPRPAQGAVATPENASGENAVRDVDVLNPLLGVKPYPSRIRCATLPWTAAKKALKASI
jgi:nitrogen fixation NifU-like protein